MKLRSYQERGKVEIYKEWAISDVIFYVMCTGSGKTVQFVDIIKDFLFANKRVMLIAHREELINQAHATLYNEKIFAGIIKADVKTNYALPCQVCSIQTISRRSHLPDADLIIIDEGHHTTDDNSYGRILARYPNAKVLIVSATPYRLSGEGFENLVDGKVTRLIVNSTIKTLILDGWLCPIRFFLASIPDLSNAALGKGDYREDDAQKAMELAPIVESYKTHVNGLQGICFAVNVKHSIDICAQYNREGIRAEHLDANTPDEDITRNGATYLGRKSIIRLFKEGIIKVVVNVGIFTEGTDFPNCQFVQLARPTKSLSMYLQMCGRATRALAGLVDQFHTSKERRDAIAASIKPNAFILDNAGCYIDHGFPDADRNWEHYFKGWKKQNKQAAAEVELMEIEIFVAKDAQGNIFRTNKIKEIEGLELIEVTQEVRRKVVNIRAIHEFDRLYNSFCNSKKISRPGNSALAAYIAYCNTHNILMVPEIWQYMYKKLITEPMNRIKAVEMNRERSPGLYPDEMFQKTVDNINKVSVSESYFKNKSLEYKNENEAQINEYLFSEKK